MSLASPTKQGSLFAVTCLVAGTCIGGGMLALPVATSLSGFIPSLVMMAVCCIFMAITGLYFVEAALWLEPGVHFVSMSSRLLGPAGKYVVVILYLFIGYASLVAYTAGGGDLFVHAFNEGWGIALGRPVACVLFVVLFGLVIFLGNKIVGTVNSILFVGMIAAYVLLIATGTGEISSGLLARSDWTQGIWALPLLLTIFSYQAVVPSLVIYLGGDGRRTAMAIVGGMVLAFLIYALWQALIFGVVPLDGANGLQEAYTSGTSAVGSFRFHVSQKWVSSVAEFFAFFALVTSFLGIGLGTYDFLADGLKLRARSYGPALLILLVTVPSLFFAIAYPQAFLVALDASGGFGDAILNGMIPVLMIISGRYIKKLHGHFRVPGGQWLLLVVFLFAAFVFTVEVIERLHFHVTMEDLR